MSLKKRKYTEDIKQIRKMMENSATFISLSGFSGILAGIFAIIAGCSLTICSGIILLDKTSLIWLFEKHGVFVVSILMSTLLVTLASCFILAYLKSKKNKLNFWDKTSGQFAVSLFVPLLAGGLVILCFLVNKNYIFIFPFMLLFYGLSLLNASKYTLHEIKILGYLEIISGILSAFLFPYSLVFWIVGFGLFNMGYGLLMHFKYER